MNDPASLRVIFVVGSSRSGTTMLGRVLGRHRQVFTFNELHFFEQLWQPVDPPPVVSVDHAVGWVARLMTIQRDGYYTQRNPRRYEAEAQSVVAAIESPLTPPAVYAGFLRTEAAGADHPAAKPIVCDQTPRNLYYLRELLSYFPRARAIQMIRDPRDVLLSQKHRWRRRFLGADRTPWWNAMRTWAGYHPITMSLLWNGAVEAGQRLADHPRFRRLRFEDLLANPEDQVRGLCEWLGLAYDPAMLEVPRVGSSNRRDEPARQGIDASAAGRWRTGLRPSEAAATQRICDARMRSLGYAIEPVREGVLAGAWLRVTWLIKAGLTLLLNLRRMRRLTATVRRRLGR